MKIAIIGAGNMGGATALGLAGALPDARITVTARHAGTLEKFAARGLQTTQDNVAAASWADIVVLAVKPWLAQGVLTELRPALAGKLLVSFVWFVAVAVISAVTMLILTSIGVRASNLKDPEAEAIWDRVIEVLRTFPEVQRAHSPYVDFEAKKISFSLNYILQIFFWNFINIQNRKIFKFILKKSNGFI